MQKLTRSLLFAGAVLGLAACGDDVSVTPPAENPSVVTGVTVAPASQSIAVGQRVVLTAQVTVSSGTGTPDRTVAWSSANTAIATVNATSGEVTGVAPGTTTIRATAGGVTGAATITVSLGVQSVVVNPSAVSVSIGGTASVSATVNRDNGVAGTVTWSSNNTAVATVTSAGVITGVAAGTAVVTARSTADTTKVGTVAVTVTAAPNNLTGFSVAPTAAGLGIGGTLRITPNPTTVGSPTIRYTYTSSNTAVATVDSTGLVTAIANGTAVITTTATTNTNSLSATTTITVASASVSIQSITQGGLGNPVNLANVAGQIEVTVNVNAGNQSPDSVVVKLGGVTAAVQTLTGAPNAPVTLSVNTAAYAVNADSTASVRFPNGSTGVQVQVFTSGGGVAASNVTTITLNNQDTFHARWLRPQRTATSAAGLIWYGGPNTSTTINVIPVMYSGNTIASATIHMDDAAVDGNAGLCPITATNLATTITDATAPFTATFECTGVTSTQAQPGVAASIRADGNPGPAGVLVTDPAGGTTPTLFANAADVNIAPIRIDVAAPTGFAVALPAAPDNWFNASFNFTTLVTTGVDAGVGVNTAGTIFQYADLPSLTWINFTPGPNNIPEDPLDFTNGAYALRIVATDLLSNAVTVPATGAATFGIDNTAPTVEYIGGLQPVSPGTGPGNSSVIYPTRDSVFHNTVPNNQALVTTNPPLFGVRIRDTRSGFNLTTLRFLFRRITRLALTGTACADGVIIPPSPVCEYIPIAAPIGIDDPTFRRDSVPIYGITGGLNTTSPGYYTYQTYAVDRATNQSGVVSKQAAIDITAPQVTGIAFPASLPGASNVAFTPNGTDDLEVLQGALYLTYPNMTGGPLRYASFSNFDSPWNGVLSNPVGVNAPFGSAGLTVPHGFLNGIDVVLPDSSPPLAVTGTYAPTAAGAQLYDIKRLTASMATISPDSSGVITAPVFPTQVTPGQPFSTVGVGKWFIHSSGTPAGSVIQARAQTSTSITNPPFPQVVFFRLTGGAWQYLGTVVSQIGINPTSFDNGAQRFWTYSLTAISPALTTGQTIRAVGMSAVGDGLSTQDYIVP